MGGANSAGQAAVHFAKYARKVTMLVRAPSLNQSMSKYLIDQIAGTSNIEVETGARLDEVSGDGHLQCIMVNRDGQTSRREALRSSFLSAPRRKRSGCPKA